MVVLGLTHRVSGLLDEHATFNSQKLFPSVEGLLTHEEVSLVKRHYCICWLEFNQSLQIITGRDNAWAREVSHGDTKSKKLQAAANDLQVLQALALENEDIVGLVREALPEVPDVWVRAGNTLQSDLHSHVFMLVRIWPRQATKKAVMTTQLVSSFGDMTFHIHKRSQKCQSASNILDKPYK